RHRRSVPEKGRAQASHARHGNRYRAEAYPARAAKPGRTRTRAHPAPPRRLLRLERTGEPGAGASRRGGVRQLRRSAHSLRPGAPVSGTTKALAKLRKQPSGDLDNIVLMAMRKEPERRYSSVEQFAEDLRRHLEGRPVVARQDTLSYRVSKFVQRHKLGVAAT